MNPVKKSYLLTSFVILFWATIPSAFKISLRFFSVIELLFFSTIASTLVLFVILILQGKLSFFRDLTAKDCLRSFIMGFLNPFLYYLVVLKAYSLLPAQQAQPLNMTWGIVLVLVSIPVLKQRIRTLDILAVCIGFLGVVVISTQGNFTMLTIKNPLGVILAVGSSIVWVAYWIFNLKDNRDPVMRLFLNFVFAAVIIGSALIIMHHRINWTWPGIGGAVYIGVFEMGVTYVLWLLALKFARTTASVTILIYIVPFLSFVFVSVFVGEKILISSIVGALFIVAGIGLNKYNELKNNSGKE